MSNCRVAIWAEWTDAGAPVMQPVNLHSFPHLFAHQNKQIKGLTVCTELAEVDAAVMLPVNLQSCPKLFAQQDTKKQGLTVCTELADISPAVHPVDQASRSPGQVSKHAQMTLL